MAKGLVLGENKISLPNDVKNYNRYLNEISKYDLLSVDEEVEYFTKYRQGETKYFDLIAQRNLRFVVSVAKKYQNVVHLSAITLEDLVSEGNIGLCVAIQKFDPSLGFKFISFAVYQIRAKITECIHKHIMTIRQPSNRHLLMYNLMNLEIELQQQYEMQDIPAEVLEKYAQEKNISLYDKMIHIKHDFLHSKSLDAPLPSIQSETFSLNDVIGDENQSSDNRLLNREKKEFLEKILNKIPTRAAQSLRMLYGLDCKPMSYKEIGQYFEVSGEAIRIEVKRWLYRLNRYNQEEYNTEYN